MKKDEELLVDLLSYAKLAVRRARGRSQDELIMDKDPNRCSSIRFWLLGRRRKTSR